MNGKNTSTDPLRLGVSFDIGKLDQLGRVRLDREVLLELGWEPGLPMRLQLLPDATGVALRPSRSVCAHCGESNVHVLVPVNDHSMICQDCLVRSYESAKKPRA